MTIRYLNPVQEAEIVPGSLAPRLSSLDDCTVGLLSNGKTNASELLEMLAEELGREFRLASIVRVTKRNASGNCPPELLDDLVGKCDAVITAIGD